MSDLNYYRTLTHFSPHEAAPLLYNILPTGPHQDLPLPVSELMQELVVLASALHSTPPEDGRVFPRVWLRQKAEALGLEPDFLNQKTLYDTGLSREDFLKSATQELLGGDWKKVYDEELTPILNRVEPD